MNNEITLSGKLLFEVPNVTNKHKAQSSWKRVAMVMIDGDVCEYYAWYLKKRYNLILNKPLRGAHISFINDSIQDLRKGGKTLKEVDELWDEVKKKYNNKTVNIVLNLEPRTDDNSWWLNIPNEHRDELQAIRTELGLGRPYFGMHMSLGYANEKMIDHSKYIHRLIKTGFIN